VSAATAATTTTTGADGRKAGGPGRAPHLFSPFTKSAAC
jgi:homeobox-leucine zipper protein